MFAYIDGEAVDTQVVVDLPVTTVSTVPVPAVRKKERNYNGMFEFKRGDEAVFVRRLLLGKL